MLRLGAAADEEYDSVDDLGLRPRTFGGGAAYMLLALERTVSLAALGEGIAGGGMDGGGGG